MTTTRVLIDSEKIRARLLSSGLGSRIAAVFQKGREGLLSRLRREPSGSVLLIDTQAGPWQEYQPVYWRATVPLKEIQADNPRAWGAYKERFEERIRWTRFGGPVGTGLGVALLPFIFLLPKMQPGDTVGLLIISGLLGVFVGTVIGIPLSAFVIRTCLKTRTTYVVGRIPKDRAEEIGLEVRPGADWALVWAVPPPVVAPASDGDASSSLVQESEMAVWTLEQLMRGENGHTSDLLIRALHAQYGTGGQEAKQTSRSVTERLGGIKGKMRGG